MSSSPNRTATTRYLSSVTKWRIFIPTDTEITTVELAGLVIDSVICQHGSQRTIISDRGLKFISESWRHLTDQLGIQPRYSTAYHPQTDGKTDRVNQTLEQYLRIFTTFNQDNRSELLWLARGLSMIVVEDRRSYLGGKLQKFRSPLSGLYICRSTTVFFKN